MLARPLAATAFLVVGLMASSLWHDPVWAGHLWTAGLWLLGVPLVYRTLRGLLRGRLAADLVAGLAIVTSMSLGHPFAGLVIVLMQTGGEALEHFAERRASAAVRALEADVAAGRPPARRQSDHRCRRGGGPGRGPHYGPSGRDDLM